VAYIRGSEMVQERVNSSKYSIYDSAGIFICNIFNKDLGSVEWNMIPMVKAGTRYVVVEYANDVEYGDEDHRKAISVSTMYLHRSATPAMVKMPNGARVDNTLGGYSIKVLGLLPKEELVGMTIDDDTSGRNTPLIPVVQRFEENGCVVFCEVTSEKLTYIPPTETITPQIVQIARLG